MNKSMQVWSPIKELWDLQEDFNRLFFGPRQGGKRQEGEEGALWAPTVDICEDKEAVKIYTELPGIKKEDVKINVEEGMLTIKGERKFSDEKRKGDYYRIERSYGMFSRSFSLPTNVEPEKIKANMKDGVLEILLPKKEEAKPKEIEIHVG